MSAPDTIALDPNVAEPRAPLRASTWPGGQPLASGVADRYRRVSRWVAVGDVVCLVIAMLAAYVVRFGFSELRDDFRLVIALAPFMWVAVFWGSGLYALQRLAPAEEFRRVIGAIAIGVTLISIASFWSKSSFSRLWVGLTWVLATVLVLAVRQLWHSRMGRMRADGRLAYRTLIVGANDEARRLAELLSAESLGFRVVGHLAAGRDSARSDGLEVVGTVRGVRHAVRGMAADCLFVASSALTAEEVNQVTKAARVEGAEIRLSANVAEILSSRLSVQPLGSIMALSLRPVRLTGGQAALKRAFDLVVSSALVVLLAPLFAAIAAAIKLGSPGPAIYRQERVGRHGRVFGVLKFRTMVVGAEAMLAGLRSRNEASGPLFKLRDDPRVTRVGRWLRRWSLDELPQLVNVLRGEMSLVGPRPPLPAEVAHYESSHMERLQVAPGLTGLWQVSGRSDVSFDEYVRLDLFYIENWSLTYDLFILGKTVPVLVGRRGAY